MPALYIVLQQKIAGVDSTIDNHALSKLSHQLETFAMEAGVKPLMSFFSVSPEEAAALLGDHEAAVQDVQIPEEKWFEAEEGLKPVEALLRSLADPPSAENNALAAELSEFKELLEVARSHNVRWHLAIDY